MAYASSHITVTVDYDVNSFRWGVLETFMLVSFYDELRLINRAFRGSAWLV